MKGFTTKQYMLEVLNNKEKQYRLLTSLDDKELIEYNALLDHLKDIHEGRVEASTTEKGNTLEAIVSFLLTSSTVFDVIENIRTSSNEIDQLITINSKGRKYRNEGFLDIKEDILLSECKNYQSSISVTWVGKFFSLMTYTTTKIGLLFSYHGLSGSNWKDAVGLTKKLYLSECEKRYILDFNVNDFNKIAEGYSLLELISNKILSIKTDTQLSQLITKHPAEETDET
jgi:hypothetical protein